jgi:feruloyl esterase
VEKRQPGAIIAAKQSEDHDRAKGIRMTRPLSPYPQIAVYTGSGDVNDAASFTGKVVKFSR